MLDLLSKDLFVILLSITEIVHALTAVCFSKIIFPVPKYIDILFLLINSAHSFDNKNLANFSLSSSKSNASNLFLNSEFLLL